AAPLLAAALPDRPAPAATARRGPSQRSASAKLNETEVERASVAIGDPARCQRGPHHAPLPSRRSTWVRRHRRVCGRSPGLRAQGGRTLGTSAYFPPLPTPTIRGSASRRSSFPIPL